MQYHSKQCSSNTKHTPLHQRVWREAFTKETSSNPEKEMCDKTQYMRPNKEEEWNIGIVIINLHGEVFDVVGITKKKHETKEKVGQDEIS